MRALLTTKLAQRTWLYSVGLTLVFLCHRYLTLGYLAPPNLSPEKLSKAFLVGAASDAWLASLWLLIGWLAAYALTRYQSTSRCAQWVPAGFFWLGATSVMLHQPYVAFFHHQFLPSHASYLLDHSFITSQVASLWDRDIGLILATALTCQVTIFTWLHRWPQNRQTAGSCMMVTFVLALGAHNRNIYLRVQWFIPQELQVHHWERTYFHLRSNPTPAPLTPSEIQQLTAAFAIEPQIPTKAIVSQVVYHQPASASFSEAALRLKKAFTKQLNQTEAPIVLVILLESQRPFEVNAYYPTDPSLSPALDSLSREGVTFTQAYSTGGVTRGGQEAAFCGYLSSANHSMMRSRPDIKFKCLPELLPQVTSFWFHNGNGEFDGQQAFWRNRGVNHLLTQDDFPPETPSTDWGKSDLALYQRSLQELQALSQQNPQEPLLGMILTMSNHVPWVIPEDAPHELLLQSEILLQPNFGTSMYADFALGEFIKGLKRSGIWERLLLVVASDHGVAGPAYQQPKDAFSDEQLRSQILLILAGGIVTDAELAGSQWPHFASQADIAPTIAWLWDQGHLPFMGEPLLTSQRQRPVVVDLGQTIYSPQLGITFGTAAQTKANHPSAADSETLTLSYYRSFLQAIGHPGAANPPIYP